MHWEQSVRRARLEAVRQGLEAPFVDDAEEVAVAAEGRRSASYGRGAMAATLKVRKDDFYASPPIAVRALIGVEPDMPQCIWEPCAGDGAVVKELQASERTVIAHDLVDWGCSDIETRIDFLMEHKAPEGVGGIVTNPPYKLANEFIIHARHLVPKTYMLLRLAYLEGERRRRKIFAQQDLARVWVFSRRLPRMHRAGYEGKDTSSKLAFAWFCFSRDHKGPPTIDWIDWKDFT